MALDQTRLRHIYPLTPHGIISPMKIALTTFVALAVAASSILPVFAETANADVFTLEGPVETNAFRQANFKWALPVFHPDGKVTPKFVKALALGSDYLTKIITPTGRQA